MAAHRNTRGLGWVGGCLIVVVLGAIVLGGGGYFLFQKAMSQAAAEITEQLEDHPVIVERIGEIQGVKQELAKGPEHLTTEQMKAGWWLWSIEGSRGSGLLKVRMSTDEASETPFKLIDGELLMGEESFPLFAKGDGPGKPGKPPVPEKPADPAPDKK